MALAGDDPAHAEAAFESFYTERNRVEFYDDALPALQRLGTRVPLAALSNGNADLARIGVSQHFVFQLGAREHGAAKPAASIFHAACAQLQLSPQHVLHVGDVFFNGMYPFIDATTGGSIGGMIEGANFSMKQADASTKIVPGHGPLGDLKSLTVYRDMLVTVRDRIAKLKKSGQSLKEVLAAQPTKDLDATWGKGFMQPNDFLAIVYSTI